MHLRCVLPWFWGHVKASKRLESKFYQYKTHSGRKTAREIIAHIGREIWIRNYQLITVGDIFCNLKLFLVDKLIQSNPALFRLDLSNQTWPPRRPVPDKNITLYRFSEALSSEQRAFFRSGCWVLESNLISVRLSAAVPSYISTSRVRKLIIVRCKSERLILVSDHQPTRLLSCLM